MLTSSNFTSCPDLIFFKKDNLLFGLNNWTAADYLLDGSETSCLLPESVCLVVRPSVRPFIVFSGGTLAPISVHVGHAEPLDAREWTSQLSMESATGRHVADGLAGSLLPMLSAE